MSVSAATFAYEVVGKIYNLGLKDLSILDAVMGRRLQGSQVGGCPSE